MQIHPREMARKLASGTRIVVATHNQGKLRELRELLSPFGLDLVSAGDLNLPEPPETGHMFSDNAAIKAQAASDATGLPALADDSGICIDALDGAPGIFSANWAGPGKDFAPALARVQDELDLREAESPNQRRAHFVSALILIWPDAHAHLFEGRVWGTITAEPRGTQGFGYDPIFLPYGETRTFGEMSADEKHGIDWSPGGRTGLSHRARAFRLMAEACLSAPEA